MRAVFVIIHYLYVSEAYLYVSEAYLYAVVNTRSLSVFVSSSAVRAAPTAKPSFFSGRTGFGGGGKENTKGTLPLIN